MKQTFRAVIRQQRDMDAAFVEVPFDVEKVFGAKRVKVKASFDGTEYRGSIVRMEGCYMIGLTKAVRKEIGKGPGDTVNVVIEKDTEERTIEVPADFNKALKKAGQLEMFNSLSYTHRKEYVRWIIEAKKEETRNSRIEKALTMIKESRKK